ncbi:MAG: hypothetical protein KAS32_19475 [Candidatus Peribacteraceae bacterium]|nr:hypothetical protein [Candidatus Peribacteraceae bacterium]
MANNKPNTKVVSKGKFVYNTTYLPKHATHQPHYYRQWVGCSLLGMGGNGNPWVKG